MSAEFEQAAHAILVNLYGKEEADRLMQVDGDDPLDADLQDLLNAPKMTHGLS